MRRSHNRGCSTSPCARGCKCTRCVKVCPTGATGGRGPTGFTGATGATGAIGATGASATGGSILIFGNEVLGLLNGFLAPGYSDTPARAERLDFPSPLGGVLSNLYVRQNQPGAVGVGGADISYVVQIDGVNTALAVITQPDVQAPPPNLVQEIVVPQGALVSLTFAIEGDLEAPPSNVVVTVAFRP